MPAKLKGKIYTTVVRSALTYGSKCWTMYEQFGRDLTISKKDRLNCPNSGMFGPVLRVVKRIPLIIKNKELKRKLFLCITLCIAFDASIAQTTDTLSIEKDHTGGAPIPIELFAGGNGLAFQSIVSQQFSPKSKFGFFNISSFTGNYKEVDQTTDFLSQSFITAEIWNGISLAAGLSAIGSSSTPLAVRPTAGLQYLLARREVVLVVIPRFDLTQTYNFETFAVFEYMPKLTKKWGIYSRIQGLYNYNSKEGFHEISSIYLRLGAAYKNFQFGVGLNNDFYGPDAQYVKNFGLFLKTDLF